MQQAANLVLVRCEESITKRTLDAFIDCLHYSEGFANTMEKFGFNDYKSLHIFNVLERIINL